MSAEDQPGGKKLELTFPVIQGWKKSGQRKLPPGSGGYSLGYNSDNGAAATIYVYNRGLGRIPDDLTSGPVKKEMEGAKDGVLQAKKLGYYQQADLENPGRQRWAGARAAPGHSTLATA